MVGNLVLNETNTRRDANMDVKMKWRRKKAQTFFMRAPLPTMSIHSGTAADASWWFISALISSTSCVSVVASVSRTTVSGGDTAGWSLPSPSAGTLKLGLQSSTMPSCSAGTAWSFSSNVGFTWSCPLPVEHKTISSTENQNGGKRSTNQSINRLIDQSRDYSINQSTDQSTKLWIKKIIKTSNRFLAR